MWSAIVLTLLTLVGSAHANEPSPKKRVVKIPPVHAITLRYDDGVIVPAPHVAPLIRIVPALEVFPDARPYPDGMILGVAPCAHRVIAVFREPAKIDDARGNALADLGLGLGALVLATALGGRRRIAMHPVGML